MRVVAMFRVSTEQQAQEGVSLDAQEHQYRRIAEREGWETVALFRGCESATQASRERVVLQQALACIRKREPDAVYVHEQSRLTRGDELEVAALLRELRERELKVIVGGVVRDLASLDERFMIGIQGLVDRAEAERIKERYLRGKREKARRGLKNSGIAPFGYRNPPKGDPERGRLRIVPEQAETVRRIFNMACEGASPTAIATALNEEHLPSPRGGVWWKSSVLRILSNPAYRGCHVTSGWAAEDGSRTFRFDPTRAEAIMVEDAHEPIVPKPVWHAAQSVQPAPRTSRPRMLTGMLTMNGHQATGDSLKQVAYYRPPRGTKGGPWIPCDAADRAVWEAFVRAVTERQFFERVLAEIRSRQHEQTPTGERDRLRAQLAKLQRRLARLTDMRADGELGRDEFADRSSAARAQIESVKQRLAAAEQRLSLGNGEIVGRMFAAAKVLLGSQQKLSPDEKRKILAKATAGIEINARRDPQKQGKDGRGRYQKVRRSPWLVESVTFDLRPPPDGAGCFDTWQDRLIREALTHQADESTPWDPRHGEVLLHGFDAGRMKPEQAQQYFGLGLKARADLSEEIRHGSREIGVLVHIEPSDRFASVSGTNGQFTDGTDTVWNRANILAAGIEELQFETPLEIGGMTGLNVPRLEAGGHGTIGGRVPLDGLDWDAIEPGETVEFSIRYETSVVRMSDQYTHHTVPKEELRSVRILAPDAETVELVADSELFAAFRDGPALRVSPLRIVRPEDRERGQSWADIATITENIPVAVAGKVFVIHGGATHAVGAVALRNNPGHGISSIQWSNDPPDEAIMAQWLETGSVTIEVHPDPRQAERLLGVEQIFGLPMRFEDVRITTDPIDQHRSSMPNPQHTPGRPVAEPTPGPAED